MGIRLLTSGGGGVNIEPASSIATDVTLTVPVTGGEIPLKDGSGTITATSFVGDGSGLTGIAGGFSNMQVFTSSGTFTVPSGITKVKVTVVGGGGNGANATSNVRTGGGGGGGAAIEVISGLTPGGTVSVTVGGAAGTSSFGAYCSATGGASVSSDAINGGAAGIGSGGQLNIAGSPGSQGVSAGVTGNGGSSIMSGGGLGVANGVTVNGNPGPSYGGGGSGAAKNGTGATAVGGAGASGVVIVEY